MNRRSSATRTAVRWPLPAVLAGVVLAITMCAFPLATAHAAPVCPPGQPICLGPGPSDDPTPTQPPSQQPAPTDPKPAPPAPTQPPAVPVAPVAPPPPVEPSPVASETVVATSTVTPIPSSAAPKASSAEASSEPNWNKPIENTSKVKQAAVVVRGDDGGPDMLGLITIMGGVLLIGLGGLAFALWSRNRLAAH